jgi:hypothetical protein
MHLVDLFLPLADRRSWIPLLPLRGRQAKISGALWRHCCLPTRTGARGLVEEFSNVPKRDDFVVYEVMTKHIDRDWPQICRIKLERIFARIS